MSSWVSYIKECQWCIKLPFLEIPEGPGGFIIGECVFVVSKDDFTYMT